jgi:hypothetical protein
LSRSASALRARLSAARPMIEATPAIAAIQGAPSVQIQSLLRAFIDRQGSGVRIVGVLEEGPDPTDPSCAKGVLRMLGSESVLPLFQKLGARSTACALDASGVIEACELIRRQIAQGCDLVVLSKFGRLEAERGGLRSAFEAATVAGIPILTSVSPKFAPAWADYAAPFYRLLAPDLAAIEDWWIGARRS